MKGRDRDVRGQNIGLLDILKVELTWTIYEFLSYDYNGWETDMLKYRDCVVWMPRVNLAFGGLSGGLTQVTERRVISGGKELVIKEVFNSCEEISNNCKVIFNGCEWV